MIAIVFIVAIGLLAAFEVPKGTKASELAKVLLKQAYTEREYKLTDWMQGAGR